MYDEMIVAPMRQELTRLGIEEARTAADVDAALAAKKGTVLVVVNSVCGCAAGMARPAVAMALENETLPDRMITVFAGNDLIAAGARQALREHGLRIPDDISLVGFDDLPPAADIDLTTVHVPHEELGRTAVRMALQRARDKSGSPEHVMLGTHIIIRDSVRPLIHTEPPAR